MKIIRPVAVTDTVFGSSTVPESEPVWVVGTTYALDAVVRGNTAETAHKLFLSVQAANVGHPVTDPLWWVEMGPSNRWAMFDGSNTTSTTSACCVVPVHTW